MALRLSWQFTVPIYRTRPLMTFLRSLREAAAARARGARRPTGAEEGEGRMSRPDAGEVFLPRAEYSS